MPTLVTHPVTVYMNSCRMCVHLQLKERVDTLRRDEKAKGRLNRQNKKTNRIVNKDIQELEEDERKLREVFPQGENADFLWAVAVLGYYVKFIVRDGGGGFEVTRNIV